MTKAELMKILDKVPDTAIICGVDVNGCVNDVELCCYTVPPFTREYEVLLYQIDGRTNGSANRPY
jgi:hypothetical protein